MDDYNLTTKDAIKVMQNLQDWLYFSSMNGGTSIQRKAIDMAIRALSHPEPHWIPCSERLPEDDVDVFIYLFGNAPYIACRYKGKWCTGGFEIDTDEEPFAWMPLPEPYKEVTK